MGGIRFHLSPLCHLWRAGFLCGTDDARCPMSFHSSLHAFILKPKLIFCYCCKSILLTYSKSLSVARDRVGLIRTHSCRFIIGGQEYLVGAVGRGADGRGREGREWESNLALLAQEDETHLF